MEDEQDINDIIKHADIAMYKAKHVGRNTTCVFEQEMSEKIKKHLRLNNELRDAVKHDQFEHHLRILKDIHLLEIYIFRNYI